MRLVDEKELDDLTVLGLMKLGFKLYDQQTREVMMAGGKVDGVSEDLRTDIVAHDVHIARKHGDCQFLVVLPIWVPKKEILGKGEKK